MSVSQDRLDKNKIGLESKWVHLISATKYILGLGSSVHTEVEVCPKQVRHKQIHPSAPPVGGMPMSQDRLDKNKIGVESKWVHHISATKYILGLGSSVHTEVEVCPKQVRHKQVHPSCIACMMTANVLGRIWPNDACLQPHHSTHLAKWKEYGP